MERVEKPGIDQLVEENLSPDGKTLTLENQGIGVEELTLLKESGKLEGIEKIFMGENEIGDREISALAEFPTGISSLYLNNNKIGNEGAKARH